MRMALAVAGAREPARSPGSSAPGELKAPTWPFAGLLTFTSHGRLPTPAP
jgi:hypothetical protein